MGAKMSLQDQFERIISEIDYTKVCFCKETRSYKDNKCSLCGKLKQSFVVAQALGKYVLESLPEERTRTTHYCGELKKFVGTKEDRAWNAYRQELIRKWGI